MTKVTSEFGYTSKSIDYRNNTDVSQRVEVLRKELSKSGSTEIILVGSSMGGYVSAVISTEFNITGLFLLCPALFMEKYPIQKFNPLTKNITIIHGWEDEIIPFENSIQFGKEHQANILLTKDNHRLSNSSQLLEDQFRFFLNNLPNTTT